MPFYNWYAVNDSRKIAPKGWHVPSDKDWRTLEDFIVKNGYMDNEAYALKAKIGWNNNKNGDDYFNFNACPNGYCNEFGEFCCKGDLCCWWASNEGVFNNVWIRYIGYHFSQVDEGDNFKNYGYSVRCILDDEVYKSNFSTFTFGENEWMLNNLNVEIFINGDTIFNAKTNEDWLKACSLKQPAWCYYKNNPSNGLKYGKLYNLYAVKDPRGLAPRGWHITTDEEWSAVESYVKSKGWNNSNGFEVLNFINNPSGCRLHKNAKFSGIDKFSSWWGVRENDTVVVCYRDLSCIHNQVYTYYYPKGCGLQVRCLKD